MNIEDLKNFKKYNPDLKIRELKNGNTTVYIIYFETLCKSNTINDFILKPFPSLFSKSLAISPCKIFNFSLLLADVSKNFLKDLDIDCKN